MTSSPQSAVDKALDLLIAVARSSNPPKLSELADEVGLPRPTAHRVLSDLVGRGWVFRYDGRYLPGAVLLQLSNDAAVNSLAALCQPTLASLSAAMGMMTNMQVLEKAGSRVIAAERPERFKMITRMVGDLIPPHRFAGALALTAALDDNAIKPYLELVAQSGHPLDGDSGFLADVARTRESGFAIIRQRSQEIVASVSRAVVPRLGSPLCSITVIGYDTDFDDDVTLGAVKRELTVAATTIEQLLTSITTSKANSSEREEPT
ncbi:IclR family transcriptional regulator [Cryobacterium sp. N21]|uniref:IclR family transcriptional regulator n=1 Tax=Cryobacterium sp. N21 TaxID=2048289 RepID=UPI000CE53023|nr:helix-turn-helix domain-containing protein [Cryobacterium sp. N21]